MKIHWLNMIAFLMTVAWVPGAEESAEIQGWTLKDGRSVQAKFVRLDGDAVKVDKDGQPFSIPLVNLSAASVTLAQKLATQASDGKPGIGAQIVAFCEGNLTKKVGDGECASLAGKALAASGAMPMKGAAPGQGDYVWGEQVAMIEFSGKKVQGLETLAQVQIGDIIQFGDMQLKGEVVTTKGRGSYSVMAQHHTAVVCGVDPGKNTLTIFHQNWNGDKMVRQDTYNISDLVSGWLRIYRPTPLVQ